MKSKIFYTCQSCGYTSLRWLGKCPECNNWNSFLEEIKDTKKKIEKVTDSKNTQPKLLEEFVLQDNKRYLTCFNEFDRVLGGGIVKGSVTLIGGEPGIGKSTLLLQVAYNLAENLKDKVLYISGEESGEQIAIRAKRLNLKNSNYFYILPETDINSIIEVIKSNKPVLTIIDSIQSIYDKEIESIPGSISQVKNNTNLLINVAKTLSIPIFIVGHVNKEGIIAGPKVLEHLVDTVLQFEGEKYKSYRILRAIKNRFGATSEIGLFEMTELGLIEISDPSVIFLSEYDPEYSGCVIVPTIEGSRAILVEIQALTYFSNLSVPRRLANGIDYNRFTQIIAILEKRLGLNLSKLDIVVNIVGGLEVQEPAIDLGIAIAIISSVRNISVSKETIVIGELGLMGEIRSVSQIEKRLKESFKLGFKKGIVPYKSLPLSNSFKEFEIIGVNKLIEVINHCFNK